METNTAAAAAVAGNEDGGGGKNSNGASFMCRQSSTRWTPTTEQIRILKDLYYNNGVRSPTAEQIQRISAKLRQYGKIEGKNVFYWFQNHKARERQKKRFTTDHIPTINHRSITNPAAPAANNGSWKHNNEDNHHLHLNPTSFYSFLSVGPAGRNYGYGSIAMEKSFRDCSITPSPVIVGGWGGVDPYYHPLDHNAMQQTLKMDAGEDDDVDDHEEEDAGPEIETLPLFPMHGEIGNRNTHDEYLSPWPAAAAGGGGGCSRASVELTLNSYGSYFPDFS